MRKVFIRLSAVAMISIACAAVLVALSFQSPGQATRAGRLDSSEPIPFFIEDGSGVPGYRASDRELANMAVNAWSRESGGKLRFAEVQSGRDALVWVRWVSSNEGMFGETRRYVVRQKPGALVFIVPLVQQYDQPLADRVADDALLRDTFVYLTCVHELGHAVGLPHTDKFEDIMYSFGYGGDVLAYFMRYRSKLKSRDDIGQYSGLSSADVEFLHELYSD